MFENGSRRLAEWTIAGAALSLLLGFAGTALGQQWAEEEEHDLDYYTLLQQEGDPEAVEGEIDEDPSDEEDDDKPLMSSGTFSGLKFRSIGPALMGGRIADIAVHPDKPHVYYIAVASGHVWKTVNNGTTWTPVFDDQPSYSIGCVELDPSNPHIVWVGTGENNSQRSVSWGHGVFRSRDGGENWDHVGLKESEHIGMIAIHPHDSDIVYVAAQGPLWRSGGDRGLYKTTDGGETWDRILHIDEDTGANEILIDPRDPDTLYCSTYQRRRHVWTLLGGGPGSGIHKSTDGGETWRELKRGLPGGDMGKIGLAMAPSNPDILYAIVEAAEGKQGVFRSANRGETWEKRSSYNSTSGQYYNELFVNPADHDHVYSVDTFFHESKDGGKTWRRVPIDDKHVDDHALWIDPGRPEHMIIGCDGGVYETYDSGANWEFKANLPIKQFYRVGIDNEWPFYNVYGGTQDNNTLGGPSRTTDRMGIANEHWFVTVGGDGYDTVVDPDDPNIIYSMWQYGGLIRHDRRSGEILDIKPREAPGEPALRWNWDSPIVMSPHDPQTLYFAANVLFRTNDRGASWEAVSGDLTRQLDRDQLEIMDRIWPIDAVAKHHATSFYGNIVSLDESPLVEGLLYVGTDDGLIQVSEDGGESWRREENFPGLPQLVYVSCLYASRHEPDVVYASFDNHKYGDFKPHLFVSDDRGRTWRSLSETLPEDHVVYSIRQDHEDPDLLFCGTEFGVFFSIDGGANWIELKAGIPNIAVQDMEIQQRENDLVLATFGRGFYILDDYSPLRHVSEEILNEREAMLFPVDDALRYVERSRLGGRDGRGSQGAGFFTAKNPPYGAVFTYYIKESFKTVKEERKEAEKEAMKAEEDPPIPTEEEIRVEARDRAPRVFLTIRNADGEVVARVQGSRKKGVHRTAWNLRQPTMRPTQLREENLDPWAQRETGPLVNPGVYSVALSVIDSDEEGERQLAEPQEFNVVALDQATFTAEQPAEALEFMEKTNRLQRAVRGAIRAAGEAENRIRHVRQAIIDTPEADLDMLVRVDNLHDRLRDLLIELRGDRVIAARNRPTPPSISGRVSSITGGHWHTTGGPTETHRQQYQWAAEEFAEVLPELRSLIEDDLAALEDELEELLAPWTPGRIPNWQPE